MKDREIFEALEVLSQHCPWEGVDIWITREPNGKMAYTAYARGIDKLKLENAFGNSDKTPMEAVRDLIKRHPDRNPSRKRDERVIELQAEIHRLKTMDFSLIPWRARPLLSVGGNPEPEEEQPEPVQPRRQGTIDVESTSC